MICYQETTNIDENVEIKNAPSLLFFKKLVHNDKYKVAVKAHAN